MTLCECGCGQEVKPGRRFIRGHQFKGYKHSKDVKIKIGKAAIGRKLSDTTKRKMSKSKTGFKHTNETKKKISDICRAKNLGGENSPNWKGGISFEPYCVKFNYKFKESVRDKFDRKCFLCGKSEDLNGRKLDVHHVNYDKECLCNEVECEFVPLCIHCHLKTSNGDREYYEKLLLEKLSKDPFDGR